MFSENDIFKTALKGFLILFIASLLILSIYVGVSATIYIKKTFLSFPESSQAQLELKVLNHEQRIRALERALIRNFRVSKKKGGK